MEQLNTIINETIKLQKKYYNAKQQYTDAYFLEEEINKKAIAEYNKQYNTQIKSAFEIARDENKFFDYEYIVQKEFKKIGIYNPINKVYHSDFAKEFVNARKEYITSGLEILKLNNHEKEYNELKIFIHKGISEIYLLKLIEIIDNMLKQLQKQQ